MPTTTFEVLRQDVGRLLFPWLYLTTTTNSSDGSTTTFLKTGTQLVLADGTIRDGDYYDSAWAGFPDNTAPDREGLISGLSVSSAIATVTFGPAFASAPNSTQVEIHGVPPSVIEDAINEFLRNQREEAWHPVSLVADAGMEASGVTDWTDSDATSSKVTTAANVIFGRQALRVANSSAGGYTRTASIPVRPYQNYILAAIAQAAVGTARLQAYDVTNSVAIDAKTTDDEVHQVIAFTFQAPSGCKELQIRLVGDEATADIYWDNLWLLHHASLRHRANVEELDDIAQVKRVEWWMARGLSSGANFVYDADRWAFSVDGQASWEPTMSAVGGLYVRLTEFPLVTRLPMVVYHRPHATLSAESDTTTVYREWVKYGAAIRVIEGYIMGNEAFNQEFWGGSKEHPNGKLQQFQRHYRLQWRAHAPRPQLVVG